MTSPSGSPSSLPTVPDGAAHRALGAVFLLLLLGFSANCLLPFEAPLRWGAVLFLGGCLWLRAWELLPSALVIFGFTVADGFFPPWVWRVPTLPFFLPLLLAGACVLPFAHGRSFFRFFRRGHPDQVAWLLVVLASLVSALALILWALWTDYLGVASKMLAPLKSAPIWFTVIVVVPGFAVLNAFAEEMVYRGVFQESLRRRFPARPWLVLGMQASAFAAAHYAGGFPNGKLGYLMTFSYACVLGYLRDRTEGMLAPYVTHVAADAVIGVTLVLLANW